jgi:hypothetical protein
MGKVIKIIRSFVGGDPACNIFAGRRHAAAAHAIGAEPDRRSGPENAQRKSPNRVLGRKGAFPAVQPAVAGRPLRRGLPRRHAVLCAQRRRPAGQSERFHGSRAARGRRTGRRAVQLDAGQFADEQPETDPAEIQEREETKEKRIPADGVFGNDPGHEFPPPEIRRPPERVRRQLYGSGRSEFQTSRTERIGRRRQREPRDRLADAAGALRAAHRKPVDAAFPDLRIGYALRRFPAKDRRIGRTDGLSLFRLRHVERI